MSGESHGSLRLAAGGIGAVAVAFGLARYGYGLLLPDIRSEFGLSSGTLGLIGAGSYAAYLAATLVCAWLTMQAGPRATVALGGSMAVTGMLVVAIAESPVLLAVGVFVAGASAGFAFPPFSDLVARRVAPQRRGRTLAAISSGTGWGVAVAAPLALLSGDAWRIAWISFAGIAAAVTLFNLATLPSRREGDPGSVTRRLSLGWLACPRSGPLLGGALLVGLGSSVYWTFAVDFVVREGALPQSTARLLLVLVGLASIGATLAGDLVARLGGRPVFGAGILALAGSLCLLAVAPYSIVAVAVSGVLFGLAYNLVLAIQAIWSARVFDERPSAGLGAVMFLLGAGLLIGPAIGGVIADAAGLAPVFLGAGAAIALGALLTPREPLVAGRAHPGHA